jgi:FtsH-binding integral membrane protein
MNDQNRFQAQAIPAGNTMDMSVDAGLRSFMLGVYNKMGLGLVLSGILAYITSSVPAVRDMLFTANGGYTLPGMILSFAPLGVLLIGMFAMRNPSKTGANLFYWTIVTLIGAGLGVLALRYTGQSLASTFFITASAFGALSLWGYTTKRDLTGFGTFLIMGMFGLLLASIVNIFLQSPMMMFVISGLGVLIFSGLIAFDTQRLKFEYYYLKGNDTAMSVATSMGALSLYLNFINLFQFLLTFLGDRE